MDQAAVIKKIKFFTFFRMAFKCPDGYDELAIEASDLLSVEDVQDDDTELYLIKAPTNVRVI